MDDLDLSVLVINRIPHRDAFYHLQKKNKKQTQIRQLLQELPDQGLLCLLMEILLDMILH